MNLRSKAISQFDDVFARLYSLLRLTILPIEKIDNVVPKSGKVIDYGSGFGTMSCYLALSSRARDVIGIEYDVYRLKKAKRMAKNVPNLKFVLSDISKIEIARADVYLLIDVLHHMPYEKQLSLLQSIINKIKKGNLIVIKEIGKKPLLKYFWNYLHDKIMTLNDRLYFRGQKWLEDYLSKKGFKIKTIKCENFFYPHFIIVAKK